MNKKAVTEDQAWEILREIWSNVDKDILVDIVLESIAEDISNKSSGDKISYRDVLAKEVGNEINQDVVIVDDNEVTETLYGKK